MLKDIKRVSDNVFKLLKDYPQLRDDDKLLFLAYAKSFASLDDALDGKYASFRQWYLNSMPAAESITRARRKIQEENPELGGAKRKKRMVEELAVREWARK